MSHGQNSHQLLCLVSTGNALITELLRIKDAIPDIFKPDNQTYSDVVHDFSYFKVADVVDKKIRSNPRNSTLDNAIKKNNMEFLCRSYDAFASIHHYVSELGTIADDIVGENVPGTLESGSMFQDSEGRQLLCEALYLFGMMLLIVDIYIPGPVRERLLVSFYRYGSKQQHRESNFDDICNLLSSTGYSRSSNRLPNYPEHYFGRVALNPTYIDMVVRSLLTVDIYNQVRFYPSPDHRAVALSNQAGVLVVCLFFAPITLHQQFSHMREVVDKFFPDNYIVPLYMGITINLIDFWDPYKAAKSALNNTTNGTLIREYSLKYYNKATVLYKSSQNLLQEGVLTDTYVMENIAQIMTLFRDGNSVVRWLLLHGSVAVVERASNKRCKVDRDMVVENMSPLKTFALLLNISELETKVRDILEHLLSDRVQRWSALSDQCASICQELVSAFGGERNVIGIESREDLKKWFADFAVECEKLDITAIAASNKKIMVLIKALEQIQEFHNIDSNVQICLYLAKMRTALRQMSHVMNIKEETLISLQAIGDFSYAWVLMEDYRDLMQDQINGNPHILIKLRTIFSKLATSLEIPLLRINEAGSSDLISVSQYFSNELVKSVKRTIQIIPQRIFDILVEIEYVQSKLMKTMPNRVEKVELKTYAQSKDRFRIAQLTHKLSVFTEGIFMMKNTLVGVIELDPKLLLEEGIRLEFRRHISHVLEEELHFNNKGPSDIVAQLQKIGTLIQNFHTPFQYVQEYLNIFALQFYHDELRAIVNLNVESELKQLPLLSNATTFIGRLAKELLKCTNPRTTVYIKTRRTWFDKKNITAENIDVHLFELIATSMTPSVLIGLEKIFSVLIADAMESLATILDKDILNNSNWLALVEIGDKMSSAPFKDARFVESLFRILPSELENLIVTIGQLQLIRMNIAFSLNNAVDHSLDSCLRTLNKSYISNAIKPNASTTAIQALCSDSNVVGISMPLNKIYCCIQHTNSYALLWSGLLIATLSKMILWDDDSDLKKLASRVDGFVIVLGLSTVLRHHNQAVEQQFVENYVQITQLHSSGQLPTNFNVNDMKTFDRFMKTYIPLAHGSWTEDFTVI